MDLISFNDCTQDETLKAFSVSLSRVIQESPEFLLDIANRIKNEKISSGFAQLYEDLKSKEKFDAFSNNVNEIVSAHDWSKIEDTYRTWGKYGWITDDHLSNICVWDYKPTSQVDADKYVLSFLKTKELNLVIEKIKNNPLCDLTFYEAYRCFCNKCYTACASLMIALIDGELIRSRSNSKPQENRKTGSKAGNRVVQEVSKDYMFGLPGYFHLELVNYEAYISTLFESAGGFKTEPKHLNRNYLQHGMSKRTVLRKDCIKLFLAYKSTLYFINEQR